MKIKLRYIALSLALTCSFLAGRASVDVPDAGMIARGEEIEAIRLSMIENNLGMPAGLPIRKPMGEEK